MERGKNTRAGVLFWTPAPARTSPTLIAEDEWEDEDGDLVGKEDDFLSQMDDNGIIGLSEALDNLELGEIYGDAEFNPPCRDRPLTPEEASPGGRERDKPPEEWNYHLSDHLSFTEAAGEDVQILSPCDGMMSCSKAQTEGEEERQTKGELKIEELSEMDKYLGMTEKEGEEEADKNSNSKRKKHERDQGAMKSLARCFINKDEIEKIRGRSYSSHLPVVEAPQVSNRYCPVSQSASPVTAHTFPLLLHFTAEEIAAAPGIEAETFPEMGFIESLPESHSSHASLTPSPRPRISKSQELKGPQTAAASAEHVRANCYSGACNGPLKEPVKLDEQPHDLERKMIQPSSKDIQSKNRSLSTVRTDSLKYRQNPERQRTPRARTKAAEVNEAKNRPMSYHTPDFSQVEPRVRFPKGGYKPPRSRRSSKRESLSPEPPVVFKSPADIVKEVLLNTTDGSPAQSDSHKHPVSVPTTTVPQEFRCRQQATTLLEQLQEDYNRLLTKYAEAENTIDRLRLEAKVNLYSELPKPGHSVHSGLSHDASKVMTLDFPQAQRAEINSASRPSNGHSAHHSVQVGQQLPKILYSQADKFLQQVQTFEDLLKRGKLKPLEQRKGLSQLVEGLNSLERGYLLARDEQKLLQQRTADISHFDSDRELEGLIYQCGLHMDELKEQVEQVEQEEPTCEAPPSPPPQPTPSSAPSEGGEILTLQQKAPVPSLLDPGRAVEVEVNSAKEESDEEEAEMDDGTNPLYFNLQNGNHRHVEQDFTPLMDHYQSFKDPPKMFDHSHRKGDLLSPPEGSEKQSGDEGTERPGHIEVHKSLPQRVRDDHQDSSVDISKQQTSRSTPPSRRASTHSQLKLQMEKSHSSSLSSLGEITASDRRNAKIQPGTRRVLSQDGILSPETDSGFVCSESSQLTPATAPSPFHQRASQSLSARQEGIRGKHQTSPVSAPSPAASRPHSRPSSGSRGTSQPRRSRQTFSCSPQHWVSQTEPTRADGGASEFGLESDTTHTVSEDGQSDQYTDSMTSLHSSHPSSSPTAWYHHGDSLRALSSRQVANRDDALQSLQAEVSTLTKRLESCLSHKPLSPMRAAPSAQVHHIHHYTSTPRIRSGERCQRDVGGGRRERLNEEEESTMRRTARERSPCGDRQKPPCDICSEPGAPAPQPQLQPQLQPQPRPQPRPQPQPQPRVSRCTQTSTATPDSCCSHTNAVCGEKTHRRQHPAVSIQVPERADEPDGKNRQAPLCPECSSCHRGRSERAGGGHRQPTHSCRHCPLCGHLGANRGTNPDCGRDSDAHTHTSCQAAESPDGARGRYAAAPALLQCMPLCPPPLLMYSLPIFMSPSNGTGKSSGVRGHGEFRGRLRRSLSADKHHCLDSSLNRAIRAARNMKHTSRHMAHSLATGLQFQELLTQSYSY